MIAFIVISSLISIICFIAIVSVLGNKWGKEWVEEGLIDEDERLELGYMGCFLGKIFGL